MPPHQRPRIPQPSELLEHADHIVEVVSSCVDGGIPCSPEVRALLDDHPAWCVELGALIVMADRARLAARRQALAEEDESTLASYPWYPSLEDPPADDAGSREEILSRFQREPLL